VLEERSLASRPSVALFLNHRGQPLTRFGIRLILRKHLREAAERTPSLKHKRLHPHRLRHYLPFLTMSCNGEPLRMWIGNFR
jgi:integrase/recombinase XerD